MRIYILFLLGFVLFASCAKEQDLSNDQLCSEKYFYYSGETKNYFKHSLYEVWIEFRQTSVNEADAKSILEKYSFINTEKFEVGSNYGRFKAIINDKCDCTDFKDYLKQLNKDSEIYSATPVFYLSDDDPMSYWILLSEVLTRNNDEIISESEFIDYAETLNLELIKSKYSTQYFKVKKVNTGFEALDIANKIYESGKVDYSHPNFIANIVLH
jgi:hypothetical protein